MSQADLRAPRPVRAAAFAGVAALHLLGALLLVRAFAPALTAQVASQVLSTFAVTAPPPPPAPAPAPAKPATAAPNPAGAVGAAGHKAKARAVAAPVPRIALARPSAPPVAGDGLADRAGAGAAGAGTGAGGTGSGPGSGGAGTGTGGGGGSKAIKIAGEISSARDYPIASREARLGDHVIIWLTVGTDGRPSACRVARASRDPAADAITCRLAMERFRFRPATDAAGAPVVSTFGWRQRWYLKD